MWFLPFGYLAPALYFWLEPVADGPILGIVSRRLFGGNADVRAALREAPAVAWRNRIFWLTPYRFHFARSIAMPLTQLENLQGRARRERAKALNPHIQNYGIGVTVAYQHLLLSLYFGVILIVAVLIPDSLRNATPGSWLEFVWMSDSRLSSIISMLMIYVAQSALQPWFVGAGFGLYINCRTHLEAWDIEVAFRRIVAKRAAASVAVCLAAGLAASMVVAPVAFAQGDSVELGSHWSEEESLEIAKRVAAREEMSTTRVVRDWRRSKTNEPTDSPPSNPLQAFFDWLIAIGSLLVEFGLWIGFALLLLLAYVTRSSWLPYMGLPDRPRSAHRRIIVDGEEVTRESLPDDVPAEVLRLWTAGERRDALALLYRASVFGAVDRHGVRLPDSATEDQCVAAVRAQSGTPHAGFFARIAAAWIGCAYGARLPHDDVVAGLCGQWTDHYGAVG